ncbi:hypothetical protein BN7_954 [Wickerhamomyces ciferrii]|uniref:Transcription factor domain-containing protein n=1 Tax=Wickerhamomyces ciferrii (strain ATCC 14091 / BCRC 22168 / CBS 111 / JCM 3599 / NBRC 0793 / NRRL Y-1031 F-60-10) TaxID=1206466 RepID=K0KJX1_WICCF|nr:uncharacterized protein BN7_954 [Wickerhamomyces ciferrii]CCH41413.1 hypothetical protein BN7_954 [Wickerhamomyces ciferrii]
MGLISKDAKATLNSMKEKNMAMKEEMMKISQEMDAAELGQHERSNKDLVNNPLFKTVQESSTSLTHFGSTSWEAQLSSEPLFKAILDESHNVLENEFKAHQRPDNQRSTPEREFEHVLEVSSLIQTINHTAIDGSGCQLEEHIFSSMHQIVGKIEDLLPDMTIIKHILWLYKEYNSIEAINFQSINFEFLDSIVWNFLSESNEIKGKAIITLNFPNDFHKISGFLLFLSSFCWLIFCQSLSPVTDRHVDFKLITEYEDALYLLAHNYLSSKNELRYLYTVEAFQAIMLTRWFRQFVPKSLEAQIGGTQTSVFVRRKITLGKILNLNKDIDIYYAHKSDFVRKQLKSLWYAMVNFDSIQSFETGIPPKITDPIIRYKDFKNIFTETPIVVNEVLNAYQDIEFIDDTYVFIKLLEIRVIKPLKDFIRKEFNALEDDVTSFRDFDFDNVLNHGFHDYVQYVAYRSVVFSIIQTFYQICYQRLKFINDQNSKISKVIFIKTMKYSLGIISLNKEFLIAYKRLSLHPNGNNFYPLPSLRMTFYPSIRLSHRRATLFIYTRLLDQLKIKDIPKFVDDFFYKSDSISDSSEILQKFEQQDIYHENDYTYLDYCDMEIDDNYDALILKFDKFQDWKFVSYISASIIQESFNCLKVNDRFNFDFITYNYLYFITFKLSKFFLRYAYSSLNEKKPKSTSTTNNQKDSKAVKEFKKQFESRRDSFNFKTFFQDSYIYKDSDDHKLNELFSSLDLPIANDSKLFFKWFDQ